MAALFNALPLSALLFVPGTGFEPAHPCERCDLNTVRLPNFATRAFMVLCFRGCKCKNRISNNKTIGSLVVSLPDVSSLTLIFASNYCKFKLYLSDVEFRHEKISRKGAEAQFSGGAFKVAKVKRNADLLCLNGITSHFCKTKSVTIFTIFPFSS